MRISARALVFSLLAIAMGAATLHAEPIDATVTITSGSVSYDPDTTLGTTLLQLSGTDGFSLTASPFFGNAGPGCCLAPGATTTFRGLWSGNDLWPGSATYNGETFPDVGSLASNSSATVNFLSSPFTLPSFDGANSTTITSPFTFTGLFIGTSTTGDSIHLTLVGSGIATGSFSWLTTLNQWNPTVATFQFSSDGDAVPEPSSIILVCLSLAAALAATRYRRQSGVRFL
jgi:hypothetical protein